MMCVPGKADEFFDGITALVKLHRLSVRYAGALPTSNSTVLREPLPTLRMSTSSP